LLLTEEQYAMGSNAFYQRRKRYWARFIKNHPQCRSCVERNNTAGSDGPKRIRSNVMEVVIYKN